MLGGGDIGLIKVSLACVFGAVFLTQATTDSASGSRNGGSMRMEDLGPVMRVVTEESPLTDEMWWYVLSGMIDGSGLGKGSTNGVRACKLVSKEREHTYI